MLFWVLGYSSNVYASFYKQSARGWHWYEDVSKTPKDKVTENTLSPTEQVQALRKDAEEKLHAALMKPTQANIIAYIKAQEKIGDRSEFFAKQWQRVIMTHPELDYSLKHPHSQNALHIYRAQMSENKRIKIKQLAETHGLLFFFRGDCKYCQGFAGVVKNFAQKYNWAVLAVQIGNVGLPEFPQAQLDNGIASNMGITHVPALIAVDPRNNKILPLAYGYTSEDEIENRVNLLVEHLGKEVK
jgi:conjugal transfer pilus assembly protein TraF